MEKVIQCFKDTTGMDTNSTVVDIGAGLCRLVALPICSNSGTI